MHLQRVIAVLLLSSCLVRTDSTALEWLSPLNISRVEPGAVTLDLSINGAAEVVCAPFSYRLAPAPDAAAFDWAAHRVHQRCPSGKTCTFRIASLPRDTWYDFYCAARWPFRDTPLLGPVSAGTVAFDLSSGPEVQDVQAVTASVAVTANLDCTVHCLHVPKGAAQPSASAVVEAAHGHTRCTAHAACVVRLGDLVPDTDYDVYCAARLSQWPQSPSAHTTTVHGPAELTTGSLAFTAAPEVFGVTASSVKVRAALSITNASLRCAAVTPSSLDPLPESWIEYADRADHKICLAGAMCEVWVHKLTVDTTYDVGCYGEYHGKRTHAVPRKQTNTTYKVAFTSTMSASFGASTATLQVSANIGATVHCAALPFQGAVPTGSQVVNATNAEVGVKFCEPHQPCTVTIYNLPPQRYDVYCVMLHGSGVLSAVDGPQLVIPTG